LKFRVILLAALLSACAADPEKVYKPAPPTPAVSLSINWAHKLMELGSDKFARLVPAVSGEYIFVADIEGNLSKYNAASGKQLWKKSFDVAFSAGPNIQDGLILLGSKSAEVFAVSPDNGELLWRQMLSSEILTPPQLAGSKIVVKTNDGKIFGLMQSSGNKAWVYDRNVPILSLRGNSTPLIVDEQVIAGFASGKLIALALNDGKLLWESSVSVAKGRTELERLIDIDGPIVYNNGVIFVSAYRGRVAAVDVSSGRIIWTREMSSHLGVVVSGNYLYLTDSDGKLWALNRDSGATLWMQDKLSDLANTRPAVVNDKLVVGDVAGEVYWLDTSDGRLIGRLAHDKVSKTSGATLYVDEIEDEGFFRSRRVETAVIFQPLVSEDSIFITYQNGILASIARADN